MTPIPPTTPPPPAGTQTPRTDRLRDSVGDAFVRYHHRKIYMEDFAEFVKLAFNDVAHIERELVALTAQKPVDIDEILAEVYRLLGAPFDKDDFMQVDVLLRTMLQRSLRLADPDGAQGLLLKVFDHFKQEIMNKSLTETATSGTQALQREIAEYLDSVGARPPY